MFTKLFCIYIYIVWQKKTYRKKVAKKPRVKSRKRTKIRGGSNQQLTSVSAYTGANNVTIPQKSKSTVLLYEEP
jgi:hypothetical protein